MRFDPLPALLASGDKALWKQFRFLVEEFGFTREAPAAERAAE